MKYFTLIVSVVLMNPSAQADCIFELASEYEVEDEPWAAICLDLDISTMMLILILQLRITIEAEKDIQKEEYVITKSSFTYIRAIGMVLLQNWTPYKL